MAHRVKLGFFGRCGAAMLSVGVWTYLVAVVIVTTGLIRLGDDDSQASNSPMFAVLFVSYLAVIALWVRVLPTSMVAAICWSILAGWCGFWSAVGVANSGASGDFVMTSSRIAMVLVAAGVFAGIIAGVAHWKLVRSGSADQ